MALAEMCIAGRLRDRGAGCLADPAAAGFDVVALLFSESNGRLLVEVADDDAAAFEAHFWRRDADPHREVTAGPRLPSPWAAPMSSICMCSSL